jgi:hypothetical protein
LSKSGGTLLLDNLIVLRAPMEGQTDALLFTFHHRFARGLFRADRDQGNLPGWSCGTMLVEKRKVYLFDNFEDGLGLKGRAVQSLLGLGKKLGVEGFGVQTLEDLAILIANTHGPLLSGTWFCTHYTR